MTSIDTPTAISGLLHPVPPPSRSLWLVRGDEGYGVRRAMLGMAGELRRRGVTIGFACLHPGAFTAEIEAAGFPVWILSTGKLAGDIRQHGWRFMAGLARLVVASFSQRQALHRVIRTFRPDWLHLRSNSLLVMAGLAARAASIPAFWHLPNTINRKMPWDMQARGCRLLCRLCGIVPLANSRHTAGSLHSAEPTRVPVLYPGIDAGAFALDADFPRVDRATLGLASDGPILLVCARVVPEKAQDRVVSAVIDLLCTGVRLTLLVVGGPAGTPYFSRLQEQVSAANAGAHIRLLGPVSDPRPYMALADVVINSRSGPEPFGLTVVESMLMERPVLAYSLGGPSETLVDGQTGWLIDEPSIDGYRRGIVRALADAERWRAMGRTARRHAAAHFSVEATTSAYLDHVARRRANAPAHPGASPGGRSGGTPPIAVVARFEHIAPTATCPAASPLTLTRPWS